MANLTAVSDRSQVVTGGPLLEGEVAAGLLWDSPYTEHYFADQERAAFSTETEGTTRG